MFYYKRNIGDYAKKAGRLSMLQHGAYTLLIDACYDREHFPTMEEAIEWTWASSTAEIEAVQFVLRKFFDLVDGRYVQDRIREEVVAYQRNCENNARIATEREERRRGASPMRARSVHEAPPNQEPLTINQEPETNSTPLSSGDDVLSCPVGSIVNLYHEFMPANPRVKVLNDARKKAIRQRWLQAKCLECAPFGYSTRADGLAAWQRFFQICAQSAFLTGKGVSQAGRPPFVADIDFIFSPSGFAKILENKYHREAA